MACLTFRAGPARPKIHTNGEGRNTAALYYGENIDLLDMGYGMQIQGQHVLSPFHHSPKLLSNWILWGPVLYAVLQS